MIVRHSAIKLISLSSEADSFLNTSLQDCCNHHIAVEKLLVSFHIALHLADKYPQTQNKHTDGPWTSQVSIACRHQQHVTIKLNENHQWGGNISGKRYHM